MWAKNEKQKKDLMKSWSDRRTEKKRISLRIESNFAEIIEPLKAGEYPDFLFVHKLLSKKMYFLDRIP